MGSLVSARTVEPLDADVGSLEIEKLADLVVLDRDLLEDLDNSNSVRFVRASGGRSKETVRKR